MNLVHELLDAVQLNMVVEVAVLLEGGAHNGAIGIGIPEQADMIPKMTGVATEIVESLNDIEFI